MRKARLLARAAGRRQRRRRRSCRACASAPPAAAAAGAAGHRRAARRLRRAIGRRHGLFRQRQRACSTRRRRTTLAAQAQWLRQHPEVVVRIEGHADPATRAIMRWRSARGAPRKCAIIWCCWACRRRSSVAISWGKERPGARPRGDDIGALSLGGAALVAGGRSQARAWRCASAISRAVISSAISARHSWPRVQPDSAARLNHLCASIRSTGDAAAAGRIGHAKLEQGIDVAALRHRQGGCGSGTPRSSD